MRTTKAELSSLLGLLAESSGRKVGRESGDWSLDHNSAYGGWVIVEQCEGGGESRPFGDRRRVAGEMADVMRFALRAIGERA